MLSKLTLDELKTIDADRLPPEIDELKRQIDQLEKDISDIDQKIGGLKNEQEKMGGGQEAADVAEHIEQVIAEIREAAEKYAKLILATSAMHEAAERYRQENQSVLLQKAGDLFSRITLKSFEGLTIDYDDNDQPILVGVRRGKKLPVEAMSDGTCDQLYLVLRLASLEQHFKNREPMPFILDDVLVNFDDARAREALKILGELSNLTQIILFTNKDRKIKVGGVNVGRLKPGQVIDKVNETFGEKILNHPRHRYIYTVFGIRPPGGADEPFDTNTDYCHYDEPHDDYVYNAKWIEFLIHLLQSDITIDEIKEQFDSEEILNIEEYEP